MTAAHSDSIAALSAALCAAQAEFVAIPKDSTNPFFKSSYAGLPKVIEVASPILTKHGLAVSQFIGADDHGDTLTTWLLHKSGEFIRDSMRLHPVKNDPQGQGSATTYARRYSYMAVLGLVADEDDDGNKASQRPAAAAKSRGPLELVTAADLVEITRAAKGLKTSQLKMAFAAAGLDAPEPFDVRNAFARVPRSKTADMVRTLAGMERVA